MPSQADLLAAIDAFLARHPGVGEARFGRDATGEPGLVGTLRKGRSPTLRVAAQIADYMVRKDAEADHAGDHARAEGEASAENSAAFFRPEVAA